MSIKLENPDKINIWGIEGYDDGFVYDENEDIEEQCILMQMQKNYIQEENMKHDLLKKTVYTMDFSLRPMPYQPGYSVQSDQTDCKNSEISTMEDVD